MCLDKRGECPVRAGVLYCTSKLTQSCAAPGTDCVHLAHLLWAASAIAEERFVRVQYHQLTIYLAKLGLRENCLVAFGNSYYPSKPLHELFPPLVLKQEPEGFDSVQTNLKLPSIAISVKLSLLFLRKRLMGKQDLFGCSSISSVI